MDRLVQKLDRRFLLEPETVTHGVAGVDEKSNLEWQVRFSVEAANFLRRLIVVGDAEIILLEIGDAMAMLISDGEDDIDLVCCRSQSCEALVSRRRVCGLLILRRGFGTC